MLQLMRIVWLCLAGIAARAGDAIHFDGPKDAKKEDMQKCAEAMAKRCAGLGYEGVTEACEEIDGRFRVKLECGTGWTPQMKCKLAGIALVRGQKFDFRRIRALKGGDEDQFKAPTMIDAASIRKTAAPAGSSWIPFIPTGGQAFDPLKFTEQLGARLVVSANAVATADAGKPTESKFGNYEWFPPEAAYKKLFTVGAMMETAVLVADAEWVVAEIKSGQSMDGKLRIALTGVDASAIVKAIMKASMPLSLRPAK